MSGNPFLGTSTHLNLFELGFSGYVLDRVRSAGTNHGSTAKNASAGSIIAILLMSNIV